MHPYYSHRLHVRLLFSTILCTPIVLYPYYSHRLHVRLLFSTILCTPIVLYPYYSQRIHAPLPPLTSHQCDQPHQPPDMCRSGRGEHQTTSQRISRENMGPRRRLVITSTCMGLYCTPLIWTPWTPSFIRLPYFHMTHLAYWTPLISCDLSLTLALTLALILALTFALPITQTQPPGDILVREAGGRVTDLQGRPMDFTLGRYLSDTVTGG